MSDIYRDAKGKIRIRITEFNRSVNGSARCGIELKALDPKLAKKLAENLTKTRSGSIRFKSKGNVLTVSMRGESLTGHFREVMALEVLEACKRLKRNKSLIPIVTNEVELSRD